MAATNEQMRETVTKYLGDLHALESHGHEAISRQVDNLKDSGHQDAYRGVVELKAMLERHLAAIDAHLKLLGGSPTSPVKDAASAVAGVAAGLYNKVRNDEASKSIRDDYTFFSHTAIAYLMLHTTALSFNDPMTATLAEQGYRDAARAIMAIDRFMPPLVLEELRQNGFQVADVADQSAQMVHDAWKREQPSSDPSRAARLAS